VCCALSLYPLYWGVTSSIAGIANQFNSRHQAHVFGAVMCPTLWARKHTDLYFPSIFALFSYAPHDTPPYPFMPSPTFVHSSRPRRAPTEPLVLIHSIY